MDSLVRHTTLWGHHQDGNCEEGAGGACWREADKRTFSGVKILIGNRVRTKRLLYIWKRKTGVINSEFGLSFLHCPQGLDMRTSEGHILISVINTDLKTWAGMWAFVHCISNSWWNSEKSVALILYTYVSEPDKVVKTQEIIHHIPLHLKGMTLCFWWIYDWKCSILKNQKSCSLIHNLTFCFQLLLLCMLLLYFCVYFWRWRAFQCKCMGLCTVVADINADDGEVCLH